MKFTLQHNTIVRAPLPKLGINCSNPHRAQRLVAAFLRKPILHTDSWGTIIYTGSYNNVPIFIATVPVGASGSGLAFFEIFAAGAEFLVRYGSNDRLVTEKNLYDVIIVDEADNLYGLMRDSGVPKKEWGKSLYASPILINALEKSAIDLNLPAKRMICHNVEDYHAYNHPTLASHYPHTVKKIINTIEGKDAKQDCWDMETAALFWRGKQFNRQVATVLQNVVKRGSQYAAYESEHGETAKNLEGIFARMILNALCICQETQK